MILDPSQLKAALDLWAKGWTTWEIAQVLPGHPSPTAVANSIGRFSGQQEEAA